MTVPFPCLLEVSALGARVLSVCAAAVFTAAVVVYGLVRSRERRLRREAVSERLMAGCTARDNLALRDQLEGFRVRLAREVTPASAPVSGVPSPRESSAGRPCPSVPRFPVSSSEGGPL